MDPANLGSVRLDTALERWTPIQRPPFSDPVPWDAKTYAELRGSMNSIPEGKMRVEALKRIKILDCGNPATSLASCNPTAAPPPEVLDWQKKLKAASVEDAVYKKALATELRGLVCTDAKAIHILRGASIWGRLASTGREAPTLVDFIMSNDCAVSAALTVDDKAKLLEIKQNAEKKFAPPPASKKQK